MIKFSNNPDLALNLFSERPSSAGSHQSTIMDRAPSWTVECAICLDPLLNCPVDNTPQRSSTDEASDVSAACPMPAPDHDPSSSSRQLKCGHIFHTKCFEIQCADTCPMCKTTVPRKPTRKPTVPRPAVQASISMELRALMDKAFDCREQLAIRQAEIVESERMLAIEQQLLEEKCRLVIEAKRTVAVLEAAGF